MSRDEIDEVRSLLIGHTLQARQLAPAHVLEEGLNRVRRTSIQLRSICLAACAG